MIVSALNDIKDVIKNADGTYTIVHKEYKSKSGARLVEADWEEVPHYSKKGELLKPEVYKKQTIAKYGKQYHAQTNECAFLGSASTLISTEALKLMIPEEPLRLDAFFEGIKIYEEVKEKHNYIISVDPAKDGIDAFSIQVIDITRFPFVQVASAQLDVDYLMMPEHLETLGLYYNEAFIIIENNEGAGQSVADMLYLTYEYPNMYKDRDPNDKKYKKFYGFRTTAKTRPLILNMMKIFIEEGKLIIRDRKTIDEFFNFVKSDNNRIKFQAEEGYHDDAVMAMAIAFAPFMQIKAFDDLELFLNVLRIDSDDEEQSDTANFYSMLDTGGFNDAETEAPTRQQMMDQMSSYDPEEAFAAARQLNNSVW